MSIEYMFFFLFFFYFVLLLSFSIFFSIFFFYFFLFGEKRQKQNLEKFTGFGGVQMSGFENLLLSGSIDFPWLNYLLKWSLML